MARRSSKNNQGGFPQSEVQPEPKIPDTPEVEDEAEEEERAEEIPPTPEPPDPLQALRDQISEMQRTHKEDLETVRRAIPPTVPKEPTGAAAPKETDWDNLLFSNPKEAVKLIKAEAVKEAETSLRAEYQRDQGTQKFWDGFYKANKDLQPDHDLVDLTLQSNLSTLANMPVDKAMERLADLTRERLLRYSGGARPKGRKAMVEGGGTPSLRPRAEPETEVTSISDLIRARRARRRATAA